jgi:hypothetical protein
MADNQGNQFRPLIETMEAQRRDGLNANDLWRIQTTDPSGNFFYAAQDQIDSMTLHNDQRGAWMDSPAGQRETNSEAWDEVAAIAERTFPDEMRRLHPGYYGDDIDSGGDDIDTGDPDYLGWQEEQRFYEEQDPRSQWYREDLYHGHPGPDQESPEARQAREYDAWEMSDEGIAAQEREIERWNAKNRPAWEKGADLETSR